MKEVKIHVTDEYTVPLNIVKVAPAEWEIVISYVTDLITKHAEITLDQKEREISDLLVNKYETQIRELQSKATLQEERFKALIKAKEEELATSRQEHMDNLEQAKKEILHQYETKEMTNNMPKDLMISSLKKQIAELQRIIDKNSAAAIEPYQKRLHASEKKLKETEEEMYAMLDKQRQEFARQISFLESTIKKGMQVTLDSQAALIEDLQSKLLPLEKQNKEQQEQFHQKLELERERLNKIHQEQIANLRSKIQEEEHPYTLLQKNILEKLEPISKFYTGSNMEKGDTGELSIREMLSNDPHYEEAIIEDMSGQAESGDIFFNYKKLKCLIEIKNKAALTNADIEKFLRDIASSRSTKDINCAILVSLRTNKFPGRDRTGLILEYVSNIPVIYIYAPPPSKELHTAILALHHIVNTALPPDDHNAALKTAFEQYYNDTNDYKKYFERAIKNKEIELKSLKKHAEYFSATYDKLTPLYALLHKTDENSDKESDIVEEKTDSLEDRQEIEVYYDDPLDNLAAHYNKLLLNKKPATIAALSEQSGISVKNISIITISKIKDKAREMVLNEYLDDDRAAAFGKFVEENSRPPTRKELIDHKILSDHSLRLIVRMTNCKKVTDLITQYFTQKLSTEPSALPTPDTLPTPDHEPAQPNPTPKPAAKKPRKQAPQIFDEPIDD